MSSGRNDRPAIDPSAMPANGAVNVDAQTRPIVRCPCGRSARLRGLNGSIQFGWPADEKSAARPPLSGLGRVKTLRRSRGGRMSATSANGRDNRGHSASVGSHFDVVEFGNDRHHSVWPDSLNRRSEELRVKQLVPLSNQHADRRWRGFEVCSIVGCIEGLQEPERILA